MVSGGAGGVEYSRLSGGDGKHCSVDEADDAGGGAAPGGSEVSGGGVWKSWFCGGGEGNESSGEELSSLPAPPLLPGGPFICGGKGVLPCAKSREVIMSPFGPAGCGGGGPCGGGP